MKEIKMDFAEYDKMVKLIETQQATINELKKQSHIVVVDERYNFNLGYSLTTHIPKVIGDPALAKEMLQAEFDDIFKTAMGIDLQIREINLKRQMKKEEEKTKNKRWWKRK